MSESPEQGHKPYLLDPREEGTRPPGIDKWWLVQYGAAPFALLPRRFHGLPPLFYPIACIGLLSGLPVVVAAIIQLATAREPLPLWLSAASVVIAGLYATTGLLQGIGTLYRRRWGLTAAYVWLGAAWVMYLIDVLCVSVREARDVSGGDVLMLVAFLVELAAFGCYYYNRRAVFAA